jgi:hypothetical protein
MSDHANRSQQTEMKPEGSVYIENIPSNPDKKIETGDYVNFEEIKE